MVFFVYFLQTFWNIIHLFEAMRFNDTFLVHWSPQTLVSFAEPITSNHCHPSPPPPRIGTFHEELRHLCVPQQINQPQPQPTPEFELLMENLDILCALQIWLHRPSLPKKSRLLIENFVETITVHPKVTVSLFLSRAKILRTHSSSL